MLADGERVGMVVPKFSASRSSRWSHAAARGRSWPTVRLRAVTGGDGEDLLAFDRGGSYPVAFRACRDAGVDWLDLPAREAGGHHRRAGYGAARQLTPFEHGQPAGPHCDQPGAMADLIDP